VLNHWRRCAAAVGEPRFTRDIDVSLLSGFGRERRVYRASPVRRLSRTHFGSDWFCTKESSSSSRIGDRRAHRCRTGWSALRERDDGAFQLVRIRARMCLEDLMVLKLFAFRDRDKLDAAAIAIRQAGFWIGSISKRDLRLWRR